MKGKKEIKDKKEVFKKIGKSLKEIVPSNSKPPRENLSVKPIENFSSDYIPDKVPYEIFPEWPSEEELNNFDFGLNSETKFTDDFKFNLPKSLLEECSNEVNWFRPEIYVKDKLLLEKLKKNFPNKNLMKMKSQIKAYYMKPRTQSSLGMIGEVSMEKDSVSEKNEEELIEEAKMHSYKGYFQVLSTKIEFKVVESFERDETEEELKKRVDEIEAVEKAKQEANKKDKKMKSEKKKVIIEEAKEITPLKIQVPRPSNINMVERYCDYSKWVSSQLQAIKDLNIQDCNTAQLVFQKIYPQKGGVPIYNPSGRYWIKLRFMGKYRKVEIDDLIPCGKYDEPLLPSCYSLEELWPALITKGLLKLYSYKYSTDNSSSYQEIGDCSIIYSVTGFIPELVSNDINTLKLFQNILSDDYFITKQKFLLCFTPQNEVIMNRSMRDENSVVSKTQKVLDQSSLSKLIKSKDKKMLVSPFSVSPISQIKTPSEYVELKKNSLKLINGNNNGSNNLMKSVNRSLSRTKTMVSNAKFKSDFSKNVKKNDVKSLNPTQQKFLMSNEKMNNILNSKSIYEENQDKQNHVYKNILTNFAYSIVDFFFNDYFNMARIKQIDFSDLRQELQSKKVDYKTLPKEEKKKYLNGLREIKEKHKEEKSRRIEELKKPGKNVYLLKIKSESYSIPDLSFILPYTEDEIEMSKKCVYNKWEFPPPSFFENERAGTSMMNKSDTELFDDLKHKSIRKNSVETQHKANNKVYSQLIGNGEIYLNERNPPKRQSGYWVDYEEFLHVFRRFILLHNPKFYRSSKLIDNIWYNYNCEEFEVNPENQVFQFSPIFSLNETTHISNISNNKYNREDSCFLIVFEPNVDAELTMKDMNFYLLADIYERDGTVLIHDLCISSLFYSCQIDALKSTSEYYFVIKSIISPFGFHLSIYSDHLIENMSYPTYLKKCKGYTIYPFKIEYQYLEKNNSNIIARFLIQFQEKSNFCYFIKNKDKNLKKYVSLSIESTDFHHNIQENEFIDINPSSDCKFIVVSANPPYNCTEGIFDIEFISQNSNILFENIQHIETFEVIDKYTPNKHGIIFKELIYSPELVYSSIFIKIRKEKMTRIPNNDPKRKTDFITNYEYTDIDEKIRLNLELTKNGKILYQSVNFNSFSIKNMIFDGVTIPLPDPKIKNQVIQAPPINTPYILICSLDLSEAPSWILKNETSNDVTWLIRVTSSDTLAFVKDTSKEDSEKALKEVWEINELGRAEKAKKARLKYQLEIKKKQGISLNEQEEKILKEERERKKTKINNETDDLKKIEPKGKSQKKEDKKKTESLPPITAKMVQEINFNKTNPNIGDHSSIYIKEFLKYCYKSRTKIIEKPIDKKISLTFEVRDEITDQINQQTEENYKMRITEIDLFNKKKDSFNDSLRQVSTANSDKRKIVISERQEIFNLRNLLKGKQNNFVEIEKKLRDIMNEVYELNISLNLLKEIMNSKFQSDFIEKALKVVSYRKEEIYKNDLKKATNKDKQLATKILDEIKNYGLRINDDVMKRIYEIYNSA